MLTKRKFAKRSSFLERKGGPTYVGGQLIPLCGDTGKHAVVHNIFCFIWKSYVQHPPPVLPRSTPTQPFDVKPQRNDKGLSFLASNPCFLQMEARSAKKLDEWQYDNFQSIDSCRPKSYKATLADHERQLIFICQNKRKHTDVTNIPFIKIFRIPACLEIGESDLYRFLARTRPCLEIIGRF